MWPDLQRDLILAIHPSAGVSARIVTPQGRAFYCNIPPRKQP